MLCFFLYKTGCTFAVTWQKIKRKWRAGLLWMNWLSHNVLGLCAEPYLRDSISDRTLLKKTIKENTGSLLAASQDIGLEINTEQTNYMVMSRDQKAGPSHSIKSDNSPFERVEDFRYLATTLTNENSFQEEIKSRLKSGHACYYSVQNLLSSRLVSKNIKIKIYRTIFFCRSLWVWNLVTHIEGGT